MRRRGLMLAAAGAVLGPAVVSAQASRTPVIGVLMARDEHFSPDLLRDAMQERGWPPSSYTLDIRSGGGSIGRLAALAEELVTAKVDTIVALQTPAALAAKRVTRDLPIVIATGDPVGTGLVDGVARPGAEEMME